MSEYSKLLKQIEELTTKANALKESETKAAIDQAKALIQQFGLTAADLGLSGSAKRTPKAAKGAKKPVAIKYADDKGNTWTGRGRVPGWLSAAKEAGKSLDQFLVKS